jgi:hypothetical protein
MVWAAAQAFAAPSLTEILQQVFGDSFLKLVVFSLY